MKALKTALLLVVLSLCARCGNSQQCGTPSASLSYANDATVACPTSSSYSYVVEAISKVRTYNFRCTADSNVSPPPNPGAVYWSLTGSNETGYGATYCNYSSPYSTYTCPPFMYVNVTRASSPTDYNRFYNQAYSYTAANGSCPQTNFVQDFQQCNGLACNTPVCQPDCPPNLRTCCTYSPVILDISGQGFYLTNAQNGVVFDISSTGNPIQMGWPTAGSGNGRVAGP